MAGGEAVWKNMQQELDRGDSSWEPAVHGQTHAKDKEYLILGYQAEILGCRADILGHLHHIPYGQYVFEHILTFGYMDDEIFKIGAGDSSSSAASTGSTTPRATSSSLGTSGTGFTASAGSIPRATMPCWSAREPKGRFYAADVAELNAGFDAVHRTGGIFYALWHPDRFLNSVIYDPAPGVDGVRGSTLVQHLAHVANRKDVWYVANGWLYSYRYVAENAVVSDRAN